MATKVEARAPQLVPRELADMATRLPLPEFDAACNVTYFLLVQLPNSQDELEAGLAAHELPRHGAAIGFHTVLMPNVPSVPSEGALRGIEELRRRLSGARYFAVMLVKRLEDATYQSRISVGRARNTDIPLRHASVSKFHAWFERDDLTGSWLVADAGSKNGTQVNGTKLAARAMTPVGSGDVLHFGTIEGWLCGAEVLWGALNAV